MSEPASNVAEFSVFEISMALKRTVETTFSYVRVRGEISGYRGLHASGHAYFSLKDDRARIEAVVWKTSFQRLRFKPEEGMEVIATGRLSTFPGSSKYQIVVEALEPAGVGALMALLEERRKKLAAEGLFDEARKKKLPFLPQVIGVVTSPTGAVIHDILHRLGDRFPVRVMLWPVRVQGETAAEEVAAAIRGFNAGLPGLPRPDVLIVARGGGSLEDLWAFNEEVVVRAAAASAIPLISAVGHETDWTLIDHAADRRAPTPTGAAEIAVPVRSELIASLDGCARRHSGSIARLLELRRRELAGAARALPTLTSLLDVPRRRLDEAASLLWRSLHANTLSHRGALGRLSARVSPLHLRSILGRSRERLDALALRKAGGLGVHAERKAAALTALSDRLRPDALVERLGQAAARLRDWNARGNRAAAVLLHRRQERLAAAGRLLDSVSYRAVLARGFALVRDEAGTPIRSVTAAPAGTELTIQFHDGRVKADSRGDGSPARRAPRKKAVPTAQGELL